MTYAEYVRRCRKLAMRFADLRYWIASLEIIETWPVEDLQCMAHRCLIDELRREEKRATRLERELKAMAA